MVKYRFKRKEQYIAYESRPGKEYDSNPAEALLSYLHRKGGVNEKTKSVSLTKKVSTYSETVIPLDLVQKMDQLRQKFNYLLRPNWRRMSDDKPINFLDWSYVILTKFTTYGSSSELDIIRKAYDNHNDIAIVTSDRSSMIHIVTKNVSSLAKVKLLLTSDHTVTDVTPLSKLGKKINSLSSTSN